jgi:hypothetical protein
MSPARVRQCRDEEANGNCLTALELLVALRRARGLGQLKPPLCTEMAMIESQPYTRLRDTRERGGGPPGRMSNTHNGDHLSWDGRNQLNLKEVWRAVRQYIGSSQGISSPAHLLRNGMAAG